MSTMTHPAGARIVAERLSYAAADGRALFHDLTLSFGRERTGLVGPNGSGKTTLVRLMTGELTPLAGTVHRAAHIAVLPQDFRPPPDAPLADVLSVADRLAALHRAEAGNLAPGDLEIIGDDWGLPERIRATLGRFGLEQLGLDRPVGTVSGGEATRVALAGLALGGPDFLVLDEPTNHLDAQSRAALYDFVESWDGGLVCASHDRELLRRMDRIVELSSLGVRVYGGGYDHYRERREEDDLAASRELESARAALRTAEREATQLRERQARREAQGRRDRATANIPKILLNARKGQAQATGAKVRAVTEREVEERRVRAADARARVEERERPRFQVAPSGLPAGRLVVELEGATVRVPGRAEPLLDGVSLRLAGPERVAVTGPNGSGKSTLLRVVLGGQALHSGAARTLPPGEIAFLDQHAAGMDPSATVLEAFRDAHPRMDATASRHALARFLFSHDAALRRVGTLSGGERLRASLARVLAGERVPSLLVLDEPTNHLDLDAVEALESALLAYDGALLVVSHDEDFLSAIGIQRRVELG